MYSIQETVNQQPSLLRNMEEGSETIPKGSRDNTNPEAVRISTGNAVDEDIVHTQSKYFKNFLNKVNKKFNNRFDYSNFIYVNAKTKGIIICPEHGSFQQSPDKHTQSKYGCAQCWEDQKSANMHKWIAHDKSAKTRIKNKKQDFIKKCTDKYKDKFTYDINGYNSYTVGKIVVKCPQHGDSLQTPVAHLNSATGCPKCGKEKAINAMTFSTENFLDNVASIYDYTYPYINKEYKNRKSKLTVVCNKHGEFRKSGQKLLSGQGCPRCAIERLVKENVLVGGYSDELFSKKPFLKDRPAILYYLSINNGEYYKIGISINLKNRLRGLKAKAKKKGYIIKSIEVVSQHDMPLYKAFKLEQKIIASARSVRYISKWSTELFYIDISKVLNKIV